MSGAVSEITVEFCLTQRQEVLAALVETLGLARAGVLAYSWKRAVNDPLPIFSHLLVARREGIPCAAAAAFRRPASASGRVVTVHVGEAHRRQGIGSHLLRRLADELAQDRIERQVASVMAEHTDAMAFLGANGFSEFERALSMIWNEAPSLVGEHAIPCMLYEGGQPQVDREIADLFNRCFGKDPVVGALSPQDVADQVRGFGSWYMLGRDPRTGKLVGLAECQDSGYFCSLAVAREFWGTGLAHHLVRLATARYLALGRTEIYGMARRTYAASTRLLESLGWKRAGEEVFYAAPTRP